MTKNINTPLFTLIANAQELVAANNCKINDKYLFEGVDTGTATTNPDSRRHIANVTAKNGQKFEVYATFITKVDYKPNNWLDQNINMGDRFVGPTPQHPRGSVLWNRYAQGCWYVQVGEETPNYAFAKEIDAALYQAVLSMSILAYDWKNVTIFEALHTVALKAIHNLFLSDFS